VTRPLLVFGWGNPSRGDDALGPLCVTRLREGAAGDDRVDWLDDYQLQVEHALDLVGRERVLFIDASVDAAAPFETTLLRPRRDTSISTHALSPRALLQVFRDLHVGEPPPCTLLAIRAEQFELGATPSTAALAHLDAAVAWARGWLDEKPAPTPHDNAQQGRWRPAL
jgi:hydrogenase maturation protease